MFTLYSFDIKAHEIPKKPDSLYSSEKIEDLVSDYRDRRNELEDIADSIYNLVRKMPLSEEMKKFFDETDSKNVDEGCIEELYKISSKRGSYSSVFEFFNYLYNIGIEDAVLYSTPRISTVVLDKEKKPSTDHLPPDLLVFIPQKYFSKDYIGNQGIKAIRCGDNDYVPIAPGYNDLSKGIKVAYSVATGEVATGGTGDMKIHSILPKPDSCEGIIPKKD